MFFLASARSCCRWRARQCAVRRPSPRGDAGSTSKACRGRREGQRDQFCFRRAVENPPPGGVRVVFAGRHRLEPFLDELAPGRSTVAMLVSSAAAIRLSLQPSPASDTSAFKRMRAFVSNWAERLPLRINSSSSIAFLRVEPDHVFLDGNLFPGHESLHRCLAATEKRNSRHDQ